MAKSLTARELRDQSTEDLVDKLKEAKEELFNLRFQHVTGQLDSTARLSVVRKDIARLNTILRQREIELHEEQHDERQQRDQRRRQRASPPGIRARQPCERGKAQRHRQPLAVERWQGIAMIGLEKRNDPGEPDQQDARAGLGKSRAKRPIENIP